MAIRESNNITQHSFIRLSLVIFSALFSITLLMGLVLSHLSASADVKLTDTLNAEIAAACTVSGGDNTYSTNLMPGTSSELGTTHLKTVCNDPSGYSIYAVGYSGNNYTTNNTKLIGTYGNIDTGTSGNTSWWAMKATSVSGDYAPTILDNFNSYHVIPASFAQMAKLTEATDGGSSAQGSNLDITYKVNIGAAQVADTYTGKVKYVLVHPNTATPGSYTIAYNANGGSGSMDSSTVYTFDSFDLPDSTFTAPSGYAFAGWCDTQDTSANPQTACSGTSYSAGDTISTPLADAGQTATLYAYWESTAPPKLYMQTMTSSQCQVNVGQGSNPTGVGDELTVYDRRDESDYTVRYINGNCWMTQNLRITHSTGQAEGTILGTDSDFSATSITFDGNLTSGNDYTKAYYHTPTQSDIDASSSLGYTADDLGAWYNYCAASAGQVCSETKTDATQDICPAGWRLPNDTGNTTGGEMFDLKTALNADSTLKTVWNPIYGGYYIGGSLSVATTFGLWWSSTANTAINQYTLYYSNGSLNTSNLNKRYGFYIRCILSSS